MLDLAQRVIATEKTLARYRRKPFDWRGESTCLHMARRQMRNMGHRVPAIPRFRSPLTARRALRSAGHDSICELLDSLLPSIPPAAMWIGDLGLMDGDGMFDAIVIHAGGKVLGYHGDHLDRGMVPIEVTGPIKAAWRL